MRFYRLLGGREPQSGSILFVGYKRIKNSIYKFFGTTSRKRELEKLTIEDLKPSSRKYPYVDFKFEQAIGKEILKVENLTKKGMFKNLSFNVEPDQKIVFLSSNSLVLTTLFNILMGKEKADSGTVFFGKTIKPSYLPQNNNEYFDNCHLSVVDWLRQYSKDKSESYVRGWLGRMLFSGEESLKEVSVLSGGERVRCMLAKLMLEGGNLLILDEPVNHLDLESITSLNKGMINFKGPILFATGDQEIIDTVANRIIDIVDENTIIDKQMSYEEYMEKFKN